MKENQVIQGKKPVAYSYVRFSTAKQELGDSLRRQVERAEKYCEEEGLQLHPVSYRDLGVSAFKRKNLEKGALAAFIDAVKTGKVEKGSYLVIEQFDRLTRDEVDMALKLLLHLVHSGIKIVTLVDKRVWDSKAVKDVGNLILAIVFMSRANNESASKADRLSQMWEQKKKTAAESGKIMTRECPMWLSVNRDKSAFVKFEDRVESVRKVFEMRIGGHGTVSIVNRANKEKWPVPGKGNTWHTSLVGRLLHNRAVLGEYQPHQNGEQEGTRVPVGDPIPGYYPPILDEQTFLRAQAVNERKGEFPGRRDVSYRNWLQGLLKCSCGHSFVRKNKHSAKQPGYARYYCSARNRGVTDCPSLGAEGIETAVISAISMIAPQFWNGTSRLAELVALVDVQQVELSAAEGKRDRFVEAIGSSNAAIPALLKSLTAAQAEVDAASKALAATRAEISELQGDSESVFENIVRAVKNVNSLDARAQLREDLSRILVKCVVDVKSGTAAAHIRGEDVPIIVPLRPDAVLPGLTMGQITEEELRKQLYDDYGIRPDQVE
jgi:DNA invertase Pin-like site-specific DNA recombinase